MGKRNNRKANHFAQKKRAKKQNGVGKPDRRAEPYVEIVRENELFCKYYKAQNVCSEAEWETFLTTLRTDLPTTFRVTGSRDEATALLDIIKGKLFDEYVKGVSELRNIDGGNVEMPLCLPWYPNGFAWQLHLTRRDIRRSEPLFKLHNFLIAETNAGGISRQEAVSMIPPIVLQVKPTDKVLDMCAAPGSKTAQLIEALHSGEEGIPTGYVVANDVDNSRCYMLVHQAKRLNSPCFVVTNQDSAFFPNLVETAADGKRRTIKFDKILCDVPCSGDGTLRKNPDIWMKWNTSQGNNLHGVQYRILRRGAELLAVGGRVVYSTCSLNPIENEAVLQRIIKDSEGALEIVAVPELLPGLKYIPGLTTWKLASKEVEIFSKFDEVPEKFHTIIRPQMFPLPPEEIATIGLEKCIRVQPHLQNSGGFFVAVLEKKRLLPWEKAESEPEPEPENKEQDKVDAEESPADEKSVPWGPQRKKRRTHGYKEDPYVFFKENEDVWQSIKAFYELNDSFDEKCLLTRCHVGKKKNIYFCSSAIRDLVQNNESQLKIINTGVKTFARCDNKHMKCPFRLAQEGLLSVNNFIGEVRRVNLHKEDLVKLLQCTDPTKPPIITELHEETQARVATLDAGSCVLRYKDEKLTLSLVGWRGTASLRAYTDINDTIHMLRLLDADISMFEKNKFKKDEVASQDDADEKSEAVDGEAAKEGDDVISI